MATPQLRPMNAGEILDASIKLAKRTIKPVAITVLIVQLPILILLGIVVWSVLSTAGPGDESSIVAAVFAMALLTVLTMFVVELALFRMIAGVYLGEETSVGDSLRFGARRLGSVIWLTLIMALGVVLGFVACLLPGVWLLVSWQLAVPALIVEDLRGVSALRRSFRLVQNYWWRSFGLLIVAQLMGGLVQQLISSAVNTGISDDTVFGSVTLNIIGTVVGSILTIGFSTSARMLMYFDLRVRKEGFDLELLARALDTDGAGFSSGLGTQSTPLPAPPGQPPIPPPWRPGSSSVPGNPPPWHPEHMPEPPSEPPTPPPWTGLPPSS